MRPVGCGRHDRISDMVPRNTVDPTLEVGKRFSERVALCRIARCKTPPGDSGEPIKLPALNEQNCQNKPTGAGEDRNMLVRT